MKRVYDSSHEDDPHLLLHAHLLSCSVTRLLLEVTCPRVHTGFFDEFRFHFELFTVLLNLVPHWAPIVGCVTGSVQGKAKN